MVFNFLYILSEQNGGVIRSRLGHVNLPVIWYLQNLIGVDLWPRSLGTPRRTYSDTSFVKEHYAISTTPHNQNRLSSLALLGKNGKIWFTAGLFRSLRQLFKRSTIRKVLIKVFRTTCSLAPTASLMAKIIARIWQPIESEAPMYDSLSVPTHLGMGTRKFPCRNWHVLIHF